MMMKPSLIVEVTRGDYVESEHQVIAVVSDSQGRQVDRWGDIDRLVFPRSTAKPLQAMALVLSGAADAWQLNQQQLALACASHNAEPAHVQTVADWLTQINLTSNDLECGTHWPGHQPTALQLAKDAEDACALHNNCSGKHCGFLSLASYRGYPTQGYIQPDHSVQQEVNKAMGVMMDLDVFAHPMGIDGCSIPTYALPLKALAMAFARFGSGDHLPEGWDMAAKSLYNAMVNEPFYVAGKDRHCTRVMQAFAGQVACKTGAEGVFGASIPSLGYGIAIKALDGNARAAEVALNHIIQDLGIQPQDHSFTVSNLLKNCNHIDVSRVQVQAAV